MTRRRYWIPSALTAAAALIAVVAVAIPGQEASTEETKSAAAPGKASGSPAGSTTPEALSLESPWRSFRGGPGLAGHRTGRVPDSAVLLWTHAAETIIESTAAIVGGSVFVGTEDEGMLALALKPGDRKGKVLWKTPNEAGIRSSPLVQEGKVYFGDDRGVFHALAAESGKRLWKFETESGSEIISSANRWKDRLVFGSYDGNLYCLAAATGKLLWKCETPQPVHATPAVVGGKAFVGGCDGQLHGVDLETGRETVTLELDAQCGASPAVFEERLVLGTLGTEVVCVNWKTGKALWRYEHPDRQLPFYSSAAVGPLGKDGEGVVVIGGRDNLVHAIRAREGKGLWTFATRDDVDPSPVIVGDRVLVASLDGNLYALELATGKEVWRFRGGSGFAASPAVGEGVVVLANEDGQVFCLDLTVNP